MSEAIETAIETALTTISTDAGNILVYAIPLGVGIFVVKWGVPFVVRFVRSLAGR